MNVYRIKFNEWLDSETEPHPDDLNDCGPDSVIVVHDGDGLSACLAVKEQRLNRTLEPYTDEDSGEEHRDFVAAIDIIGHEMLHTDVEILEMPEATSV